MSDKTNNEFVIMNVCSVCKHNRLNGLTQFWLCDGVNCHCWCMFHRYDIIVSKQQKERNEN